VSYDQELSIVPSRLVVVFCMDCDRTQLMDRTGKCCVCGSHSVLCRGAIKEIRKQLALQSARKGAGGVR